MGSEKNAMTEILHEQRMPRKAKAILNNMLMNRQITEGGLRFLVCSTDPFHDTEVCSDGYPDISSTRSITQTVVKSVSVGPPTGVTGAWDAHVFFAPVTPPFTQGFTGTKTTTLTTGIKKPSLSETGKRNSKGVVITDADDENPKYASTDNYAKTAKQRKGSVTDVGYYRTTVDAFGGIVQASGSTPFYSGWNVTTVPNGEDLLDPSVAGSYPDIMLPPTYTTGYYRLVGVGLEVTNTTAQLYKGGSVVSYRSPSPKQLCQFYIPMSDVQLSGCACTMPPTNVADATLYPNSKTWAAEDGVYLIATQNTTANDYVTPIPGFGGLMTPSSYTQLSGGEGWLGYFPSFLGDNALQSSLTTVLPFDVTGCIFSGLNNQSTLTVTVRYYIERHPTIADPDLLVLARPAAPYDPVALEIYSRAMGELPVGVPVGMNPMGEWFNDVIAAVAEWAPKIGSALGSVGIPLAQPIGNMVGAFAKGRMKPAPQKSNKQMIKPSGPPKKEYQSLKQLLAAAQNTPKKKNKKKKKKRKTQ